MKLNLSLWAALLVLTSATNAAPVHEAVRTVDGVNSVPLQLHPENPHYFLWRGRPTILLTAGEHYGAVLNLDFDYRRYLGELETNGFNLTRAFSGTYREVPGSFNITGNTLAPAPGRFLCPWATSQTSGSSDGGNRYDLTKWDNAYWTRLKDFIQRAGESGIVVELVLFCTMYDEAVWQASPMNGRNNVNDIGRVGRHEVYNGSDKGLLAAQKAVTQKLVTELNPFDNLYYEICNEPYERGGLTKEWNDQIIATIADTEAALPKKHLIAQGFPATQSPVAGLDPRVSVLNFHAAQPQTVGLNYHYSRVLAFDETGGVEHGERKYRTEGWDFLLAGGAVYSHLDFSFTAGYEDGTAMPLPPRTPGGGGPELRRQLRVLKEFLEGFDFIRMSPAASAVKRSRFTPMTAQVSLRALAKAGEAYAIYIRGGAQADLDLDLSPGRYQAEWVNTKTGARERSELFSHAGGSRTVHSPVYSEDIALRVLRR